MPGGHILGTQKWSVKSPISAQVLNPHQTFGAKTLIFPSYMGMGQNPGT